MGNPSQKFEYTDLRTSFKVLIADGGETQRNAAQSSRMRELFRLMTSAQNFFLIISTRRLCGERNTYPYAVVTYHFYLIFDSPLDGVRDCRMDFALLHKLPRRIGGHWHETRWRFLH